MFLFFETLSRGIFAPMPRTNAAPVQVHANISPIYLHYTFGALRAKDEPMSAIYAKLLRL